MRQKARTPMAMRKNGPRAGSKHGIMWPELAVGKAVEYVGTPNGARTNAFRANKRYPKLNFRTYKKNNRIYIERTK